MGVNLAAQYTSCPGSFSDRWARDKRFSEDPGSNGQRSPSDPRFSGWSSWPRMGHATIHFTGFISVLVFSLITQYTHRTALWSEIVGATLLESGKKSQRLQYVGKCFHSSLKFENVPFVMNLLLCSHGNLISVIQNCKAYIGKRPTITKGFTLRSVGFPSKIFLFIVEIIKVSTGCPFMYRYADPFYSKVAEAQSNLFEDRQAVVASSAAELLDQKTWDR